ncbi:MAG: hypothetical protein ABEJ98_05385 [Candidatus Nanohaloarchaea archaeon]
MAKDEVEIGDDAAGDDYEVVPVGPIRKLERRIDEIEAQKQEGSSSNDELIRDVLDIMKSNQKIVNDMTESTHELKNSVEDLTHKMDSVIDNMNQFMDLLEEASEADLEGEVMADVHSRIADAVGNELEGVAQDIKSSNKEVVENLEELNKSIQRSYTAQKKDEILDNSSGQRSGGQDRGLNIDRGNDSQESRSRNSRSSNSGANDGQEKMKRLRQRFEKKQDEQ